MHLEQSMPWKMSGHQPFTFCVNGIHWMLSGVFATTATMELRNLIDPIDQYCYDCSEGWFMLRPKKNMIWALPRSSLRLHCKKYLKFVRHLERQYFTRSEKFTKYFRMDNNLPLHGVNTSNITEASFRVFRDVTLNRTKCFNACELQLEMLKDDASYYRDKL